MPAKDIFLSYASEDRDRIEPLVRAFEDTGWTVFWDRAIPTGRSWSDVLEDEITTCRSLVVVWSESSVRSAWVREEANEGKRRRVLFPVRIDTVDPPFGYRETQVADLAAWDGSPSAPPFQRLVEDLAMLLRQTPLGSVEGMPATSDDRRAVEAKGSAAKYYLYISDAKVDMLYAQISEREKRATAADLDIDLKGLSSSLPILPLETRCSRLRIVADFVRRHQAVGTVDEPDAYFEGTLPMSWGPLEWDYRAWIQSRVVWFGGRTDWTVVGLGGSGRHVLGSLPPDEATMHSSLPHLVRALLPGGDFDGQVAEKWLDDIHAISKAEAVKERLALGLTELATKRVALTCPAQRLEFLARRLFSGPVGGIPEAQWLAAAEGATQTTVLLGTPLYVALAE